MQHFIASQNVGPRAQTRKLSTSLAKEKFIERSIFFDLGLLRRGFESGLLYENHIENADETHFFNMDNGKTLRFKGDSHVKYPNVISGG